MGKEPKALDLEQWAKLVKARKRSGMIVIGKADWEGLMAQVADIRHMLRGILINQNRQETEIMGIKEDMAAALDGLESNTKAIDGVEESAEAAFTRLADLIAKLKDSATIDPATVTRISTLSDALRDRAARLGKAVEASPTE